MYTSEGRAEVMGSGGLRFSVGDRVQCSCQSGDGPPEWATGTVTAEWYRDEEWPHNRWAAYQVQLDPSDGGRGDGMLIYAPLDKDQMCRAVEDNCTNEHDANDPGAGVVSLIASLAGQGNVEKMAEILGLCENEGLAVADVVNRVFVTETDPASGGVLKSTALCQAAAQNEVEAMQRLLDHRADPNIASCSDPLSLCGERTPLIAAAICGSVDALELLLRKGAEKDHKELQIEWTALHWSCFEGHIKCAEALVRGGADHSILNFNGLTAADLAAFCTNQTHNRAPRVVASLDRLGVRPQLSVPGPTVQLHGLQSAAGKRMNGKLATLEEWDLKVSFSVIFFLYRNAELAPLWSVLLMGNQTKMTQARRFVVAVRGQHKRSKLKDGNFQTITRSTYSGGIYLKVVLVRTESHRLPLIWIRPIYPPE